MVVEEEAEEADQRQSQFSVLVPLRFRRLPHSRPLRPFRLLHPGRSRMSGWAAEAIYDSLIPARRSSSQTGDRLPFFRT